MPESGEFLRVVDTPGERDQRPENVPNKIQHMEIINVEEGIYDVTVDGFGMIAVWKGDRTLTISIGTNSQSIQPGEHAAGMPGLTFETIVEAIHRERARIEAGKIAVAGAGHGPIAA